jgi:hypothetical protein
VVGWELLALEGRTLLRIVASISVRGEAILNKESVVVVAYGGAAMAHGAN